MQAIDDLVARMKKAADDMHPAETAHQLLHEAANKLTAMKTAAQKGTKDFVDKHL